MGRAEGIICVAVKNGKGKVLKSDWIRHKKRLAKYINLSNHAPHLLTDNITGIWHWTFSPHN